jgi:hypothetical protein
VAAPQHWVVLEGLHNKRPQGQMAAIFFGEFEVEE